MDLKDLRKVDYLLYFQRQIIEVGIKTQVQYCYWWRITK